MGAREGQHGFLAALVLTIPQACCGWVRQQAPSSPEQKLLGLCCLKWYQGCCLHPLALGCGFCCWAKLVLGLTVLLAYLWGVGGNEGRLGLCCLSLGGESSSLVSCVGMGLGTGCASTGWAAVRPPPQLSGQAQLHLQLTQKCIVLMHCRNVCNVFKPCNCLNNRAAIQQAASVSSQHPRASRGCSPRTGSSTRAWTKVLPPEGKAQGWQDTARDSRSDHCPPFINCCMLSRRLWVLGEPGCPSTCCPAALLLHGPVAQHCCVDPKRASAPRPPSGSFSTILRGERRVLASLVPSPPCFPCRPGPHLPQAAESPQRCHPAAIPGRPPPEPPQGPRHASLARVPPDEAGALLGPLGPAAPEQAPQLRQPHALEDVGRGSLAAAGCGRRPPRRVAHHRGRRAHGPGRCGHRRDGVRLRSRRPARPGPPPPGSGPDAR